MISGLAKSEVMPRDEQVFATAMSFSDEPVEIPSFETTATSYSEKNSAKKNRTTF